MKLTKKENFDYQTIEREWLYKEKESPLLSEIIYLSVNSIRREYERFELKGQNVPGLWHDKEYYAMYYDSCIKYRNKSSLSTTMVLCLLSVNIVQL